MLRTLGYTSLLIAAIIYGGCEDDLNVSPGPPVYPLEINVISSNSSVKLTWTEATVSTFEEYIIVRSIDSIPDTPEPELDGGQQIIERIDQREITTFTDFSAPIENTLYYKVFAKIGERFLISPTVKADLSFQVIDLRADAVAVMKDKDKFIAFDRILDVLFRYDYVSGEIEEQVFANYNQPIIRTGFHNGAEEIYIYDRFSSTIQIYSAETLNQVGFIATSLGIIDMTYSDGFLFIVQDNVTLAVYRRSSGTRLAQLSTDFSPDKDLHVISSEDGVITLFEVLQTHVNRYRFDGTSLTRTGESSPISGTSQLISAMRPGGSEVVAYSTGRIIEDDLDASRVVSGTPQFFNMYDFTAEGNYFAASAFNGNQPELRIYSTEEDYSLERTIPLSQIPFHLFTDNDGLFSLTLQFFQGGSRTVVSKYPIE